MANMQLFTTDNVYTILGHFVWKITTFLYETKKLERGVWLTKIFQHFNAEYNWDALQAQQDTTPAHWHVKGEQMKLKVSVDTLFCRTQ